jgi:hypothetical protein
MTNEQYAYRIAHLMYPGEGFDEVRKVKADQITESVQGWSDRMAVEYLVELENKLKAHA